MDDGHCSHTYVWIQAFLLHVLTDVTALGLPRGPLRERIRNGKDKYVTPAQT